MVNTEPFTIRLRAARLTDLDRLFALDQVCFRVGIAYSKEELSALLQHRTCVSIVAEDDSGTILGFAIGQFAARNAHRAASIVSIDVDPEHRRHAVGRTLMHSLEQGLAARGARAMRLEVAVDDPAALAFYERLGYRTVRRIREYYMGTLDAYSMEKALSGDAVTSDAQ